MNDLSHLRDQLNTLDKEIMDRLNKRFTITKQIGEVKKQNQLPIENIAREKEILKSASPYPFHQEIKTLYQTLFIISKTNQK